MDPPDDHAGLSPGASELLTTWFRSRVPPRTRPLPTEEALVLYLSGAMDAIARQPVEEALVASAEARRLLREVHDALRSLQAAPLPRVSAEAASESLPERVARHWLEEMRRRLQSVAGWASGRAGYPVCEHPSILAGLGARLSALAGAPRFAEVRGAPDLPDPNHAGSDYRLVSARANRDGSLEVSAVREQSGTATLATSGERGVVLVLAIGGERCPLGEAVLPRPEVRWHLPGTAAALGAPPGDLPLEAFRVIPVDAETGEADRKIPLPVLDEQGRPERAAPGELRLRGLPRCSGGYLQLIVSLPEETRDRFASAELELCLAVSSRGSQLLGRWALRELGAEARLRVLCAVDGELTLTTAAPLVFRLRRIRPAPA